MSESADTPAPEEVAILTPRADTAPSDPEGTAGTAAKQGLRPVTFSSIGSDEIGRARGYLARATVEEAVIEPHLLNLSQIANAAVRPVIQYLEEKYNNGAHFPTPTRLPRGPRPGASYGVKDTVKDTERVSFWRLDAELYDRVRGYVVFATISAPGGAEEGLEDVSAIYTHALDRLMTTLENKHNHGRSFRPPLLRRQADPRRCVVSPSPSTKDLRQDEVGKPREGASSCG